MKSPYPPAQNPPPGQSGGQPQAGQSQPGQSSALGAAPGSEPGSANGGRRKALAATALIALLLGGWGIWRAGSEAPPDDPFLADPADALHAPAPDAQSSPAGANTAAPTLPAAVASTVLPPQSAPKITYVPALITVQVAGMVRRPGVYTMPATARIGDAIRKAGGAKKGGDIDSLNLAGWLQDGARIEVLPKALTEQRSARNDGASPIDSVTPDVPTAISSPNPIVRPQDRAKTSDGLWEDGVPANSAASGGPAQNTWPADQSTGKTAPVDLNRANLAELDTIPEIGPTRAQLILTYRQVNGGFRSVDDLAYVPGFGVKLVAKIRPYVYVSP